MRVEKTLSEATRAEPTFSMIHGNARANSWPSQVEALQANIPRERSLCFCASVSTSLTCIPPCSMSGLWTRTTRNALDNPIAPDACGGSYGELYNSQYLKGVSSVDELATLLRHRL